MLASNNDDSKKIVYFGLFFLMLLALSGYDIFYNYRALTQKAMLPPGAPSFVLEVKPLTSAKHFVNQLHALHLVRSNHVLLAMIRWKGYSNHLQAGLYQVTPGESVIHLLQRVVKGDVLIAPFRILEGATLTDIKQTIQNSPYLKNDRTDFSSIAGQHPNAEGLFLADTYYYKAGSQAFSVLKQANQNLLTTLAQTWQTRSPNLPYKTPYELLVAASIIEKEASLPLERNLISGIIVNRLKLKMPLQMDPTVIYALNNIQNGDPDFAEKLKSVVLRHEDLKIKSPYNTYINRGLPPTPIAMVGKESLTAAAHPEETDYLYFFAKGDGSHQFSKTYKEQQNAIQQFKVR